jgi:hypothetical protein
MITTGDPNKLWQHIEKYLNQWKDKLSPVRWKPWRTFFTGREGIYVSLRFFFLLALARLSSISQWYLKAVVLLMTSIFILDIVIYMTGTTFVSRAPKNRLRSAILATFSFVQLPITFAVFYRSLPTNSFCPSLSTTVQALYFSFVTITTLGYGDIKPKSDASVAQILVIAEVIIGFYFIAILIARLINLSTYEKKCNDTNDKYNSST